MVAIVGLGVTVGADPAARPFKGTVAGQVGPYLTAQSRSNTEADAVRELRSFDARRRLATRWMVTSGTSCAAQPGPPMTCSTPPSVSLTDEPGQPRFTRPR